MSMRTREKERERERYKDRAKGRKSKGYTMSVPADAFFTYVRNKEIKNETFSYTLTREEH